MYQKIKVEISKSNLLSILGEDFDEFEKNIINHVYCASCNSSYNSTIKNYSIFLNDLDDVLLEGFCKKCNHPVNRYVETGEVAKYQTRISKVKKILKDQ